MRGTKRVGFFATSALVLALGIPAMASAALTSSSDSFEVTVTIADLDLNKDAGIETLYSRIAGTAARVCGPTTLTEAGSIKKLVVNKDCQDDFIANAVAKINNSKLTALHSG